MLEYARARQRIPLDFRRDEKISARQNVCVCMCLAFSSTTGWNDFSPLTRYYIDARASTADSIRLHLVILYCVSWS